MLTNLDIKDKKKLKQNKNKQKEINEVYIQKEFIEEGKVKIRQKNIDGTFAPFYNPAQELNRDLSVLAIATYIDNYSDFLDKDKQKISSLNKTFSVVDAMSATGLRAVRYFKEIQKLDKIIANDIDSKAIDLIKLNIDYNVSGNNENLNINTSNSLNTESLKSKDIFEVTQQDCVQLLYNNNKNLDIIDLDPYGSAISMIDSALWAVKNNGLILATFTDMQILCGNMPETCYYKYNSIPYKTSYCHEMAKRIAMHSIVSSASKYKKHIIPLISFNAEFYIRLIFIVKDSPELCKDNIINHSSIIQCRLCQYRYEIKYGSFDVKGDMKLKFRLNNYDENTPNKCPVCNSPLVLAGPIYNKTLHNYNFLLKMRKNLNNEMFKYLKYNTRLSAIIDGMIEEHELQDECLSYDYSQMCSDINMCAPKISLINGGLISLGYKMKQSYYNPILFKTNCPSEKLYDVFKIYKKQSISEDKEYFKNIKENTYKYNILSKPINTNISPIFKNIEISCNRNSRYLPNPIKNWGPKGRAKEIIRNIIK